MPVIKEQDLVKLYSELDSLKVEKSKLQAGFVDLKIKSTKIEKRNRRNKILIIIAAVLLVALFVFWYFDNKKTNSALNKAEEKELFLLDSIQKLTPLVSNINNAEVVYSIQLGVFKKLDIEFNNDENTNFKEIVTENGNVYQIGSFTTYKRATRFKEEIKKIGLKDVFLVPYNRNKERIDIKEALGLSNEEEFIKD
jgi:hypothetical protein